MIGELGNNANYKSTGMWNLSEIINFNFSRIKAITASQ